MSANVRFMDKQRDGRRKHISGTPTMCALLIYSLYLILATRSIICAAYG
jgi:UDP-N-acetylmuramyl pentapeptide phosphotransferase/UDP-N-acetylglucosamine-1-phosphate transferase